MHDWNDKTVARICLLLKIGYRVLWKTLPPSSRNTHPLVNLATRYEDRKDWILILTQLWDNVVVIKQSSCSFNGMVSIVFKSVILGKQVRFGFMQKCGKQSIKIWNFNSEQFKSKPFSESKLCVALLELLRSTVGFLTWVCANNAFDVESYIDL